MKSSHLNDNTENIIESLLSLQSSFEKDIKKANFYRNASSICAIGPFLFSINFRFLGYFNVIFILMAIISIPLTIYFFSLYQKYSKVYKTNYKSQVVNKVLQYVLPGAKYEPEKGFESDILFKNGSGVYDFKTYDFRSEDYISANYNNWMLEAGEVYATMKYGKDSSTTVFQGVALKLTLPVFFSYDLVIQSKNTVEKASYKKEIRLESKEWEDTFYIYCLDDIFVRYILNPAVMVRILEMYKKYPNLGLSFKGNNIYILWNNGHNLFEPIVKILNKKILALKVKRDIENWQIILGLVEQLQLGKEIWSQKQFLSHLTN